MVPTHLVAPVGELLTRHSTERPDKIAFADDRRSVTYAELDRHTRTLAEQLVGLGLEPLDRLLMYLNNGVEVVEGYLAAPRAGIVTACATPLATANELAHMLDDSEAKVVLTDPEHLPVVASLATERPRITTIVLTGDGTAEDEYSGSAQLLRYDDLISRPATGPDREPAPLDEWSWMLYTSGTTGRPKGVHLTQRGCLWDAAASWVAITDLGSDDVVLSPLPLFHSYALVLTVLGVAATGATAEILTKFSPAGVLERLSRGGVTFLPGVPTMFRYLLNAAGSDFKAPGLRVCVSAGALMPAQLNQEFEKATGILLLDGYGITETSTMVTLNAPVGDRVPGSCGFPIPGVTVRLVGPTGEDVLPGEEGELWVQGPNVMPGYHNLPDATAAVLTRGWYHTGDLARRDENGFLVISGRVKELIIRGGENIYPAEVEEALMSHESVRDAAVIGVPHEDLGEVPVGCVVAATPGVVDSEALLAHCRERLAYFKIPNRIVEVAEIPRTGSGKIQRFHLREAVDRLGTASPAETVSQ